MQQESVGSLDIWKPEKPRLAKPSICIISLEAVVDTCHGEKYRPQGRNVVNTSTGANHRLIVRKRPIRKTEARREVRVNVSQRFRPARLLRRQERGARSRAGIGIDIVW